MKTNLIMFLLFFLLAIPVGMLLHGLFRGCSNGGFTSHEPPPRQQYIPKAEYLDRVYTCADCGVESHPDKRIIFATESWCMQCACPNDAPPLRTIKELPPGDFPV